MRALRLVRIAADAERLHIQARIGRGVRQTVLGAGAGVFALCALGFLHAIGYIALRERFTPIVAASIVFAVDVVLAAILGIVASRGGESTAEREAREVREHALAQLRDAAALYGVMAPVGRLVGKRGIYGMTLAALTARFLSSR